MSQDILNHVAKSSMNKRVPILESGMTIRVHQRIKEGAKERVQIFEGLVIGISSGTGVNKTYTVRKIVDGIGVEKVFPFYAPSVEKIELLKKGKVRRAKLYYMRDLSGKSTRLRDVPGKELKWIEAIEPDVEEAVEAPAEEPAAEEAVEAPVEEVKEEAKEEEKAE
ncbi:MAG: large subunit ribosomal protein L19 [Oceanicoccus sp.]|jgi:large subunit ribosomal protein L19